MLTILVVYIPTGITRLNNPASKDRINLPRTQLDTPFRVEPDQTTNSRMNQYTWTWSGTTYVQSVQGYIEGLVSGNMPNPVIATQTGSTAQSRPPTLIPTWTIVRGAWFQSFVLFCFAMGVGVTLGAIIGAMSRGSRLTRSLALGLSVGGMAIPDFLLVQGGWMLTIWTWRVFDFRLWSVTGGSEVERAWLLPALVLCVAPMGYAARLTASALDEVMQEDYIRTARSKGLPEIRVLLGHALGNVLPRVLNGVPTMVNVTLSSMVVVELLCQYPGLGLIVGTGSPQTVATASLVFCLWYVLVDGLVNTLRILVSPRLKEVQA